jgi:serine/threonine protein kinase
LHDKNIVHCDIKSANIMLSEDGTIRIIDIGSAHKLGTRPKHCWWTARYTPPEVLEGGDWTPQGDLASLGYLLLEMLSGRPDVLTELPGTPPESIGPSVGSDSVSKLDEPTRQAFAAAKRQLPNRLEELALLSNRLKKLCMKLIHPDPTLRFTDARTAIYGEDGTHRFLRELVNANLDSYWFGVMESWIKDMKNSVPAIVDCGQ